MSQSIKIDAEYKAWIEDIVNKKAESKWGSNFFDALSRDMKNVLPGVQGLSASNLRYMKRFYEL